MARSAIRAATGSVALLVGTCKGAFILKADSGRRRWRLAGPHFFGHIVHHMLLDPRDRKTLLVAARTGHLGPTVFRSADFGRSWREAKRPPAFPRAKEGASGREVDHVFWLTPGHDSERGAWYAGSSPQGLFRSADGGETWDPVAGFNEHPMRDRWTGGEKDGTPDGPKMHSILVDPRDAAHLYIGMSSGGVFESRDRGASWRRLDRGLPRAQAWWTVKRQALSADGHDPVGIYFGTTSGELWASANEGKGFGCIARNLPHIYSVEAAELRR